MSYSCSSNQFWILWSFDLCNWEYNLHHLNASTVVSLSCIILSHAQNPLNVWTFFYIQSQIAMKAVLFLPLVSFLYSENLSAMYCWFLDRMRLPRCEVTSRSLQTLHHIFFITSFWNSHISNCTSVYETLLNKFLLHLSVILEASNFWNSY